VKVGQRLLDALRTPAIRIFVWSRLAIWAFALGVLLAFGSHLHPEYEHYDSGRLHELGRGIDVWARWDSDWYLRVAHGGYDGDPSSTPAFFPLYPGLVALLGRLLLGNFILAGVLLSLAAGAVAFVLLYRLAQARVGAAGALRAVLYLAVFPTALFLQAVYSESLYLALVLAAFLLAERGRFLGAGAAAGLAMLTRPVGLALLPALALLAWRSEDRRGAFLRLAIAAPIAALYPLMLGIWTQEPLGFLRAQDGIWQRELSWAGPLGGIWNGVTILFADRSLHDSAINLYQLGFTLLFVVLTVVAWRRLGAPYGLFAACSLAIPLSFPSDRWPLLSMSRFGLVIFPLVLALALLGARPRLNVAIVSISTALLGVSVVQWSLWRWVA
jgi:Dolichyl-phosphate-mannose-protein mannosyltransferase